jgi:hypothetical protein|tara:strand:+ start:1111 stop:1257 length:147 start_codon:yes stop_codon:yes gene_type:complete
LYRGSSARSGVRSGGVAAVSSVVVVEETLVEEASVLVVGMRKTPCSIP